MPAECPNGGESEAEDGGKGQNCRWQTPLASSPRPSHLLNLVISKLDPWLLYMSDQPSDTTGTTSRGRGKSRGGLGKYLRAKGRRGGGRPAEFGKRLLLDGEGSEINPDDEEAQEAAREEAKKYARRQLGTNADRYKEEELELDSDGAFMVLVISRRVSL